LSDAEVGCKFSRLLPLRATSFGKNRIARAGAANTIEKEQEKMEEEVVVVVVEVVEVEVVLVVVVVVVVVEEVEVVVGGELVAAGGGGRASGLHDGTRTAMIEGWLCQKK
jgi:hypothetical protein